MKNADEPEPEDGEVRTHDVRRVLRPAEAGLDQREARLHEDHEHRVTMIHRLFNPSAVFGS